MVHRRAPGGEEELLGVEVDVAHVLSRVVAARGEPGGVLAGVAQVPDVAVRVVVTNVGEEDRGAGEMFEDLHREGCVHVGLGGADVRLLGAVPVVGVVEEGFGYVHRGEVGGQLGLAFYAGEVQVPLLYQLAHHVVGPDLALQDLRREPVPVVVHPGGMLFEPFLAARTLLPSTSPERLTSSHWSISSTSTPNFSIHWSVLETAVYMPIGRPPIRPKVLPRGSALPSRP